MKEFLIKTILSALVIVLFSTGSCSKYRSDKKLNLPTDWYLSLNNTKVTPFDIKEDTVSYRIQFKRQNDSKDSVYFIRVAEAVFPKRSKILSAKRDSKTSRSVTGSWYFERLWWHEKFEGYQIPYALTGDTVNYYLNQYSASKKELKRQQKDDQWKASKKDRVEYYYSATVKSNKNKVLSGSSLQTSQSGLTIVTLKMKWLKLCGQGCGWGFEKSREIWFSNKRTIIKILGDGIEDKWKREPEKPFSSDEWITF